MAVLPDVLRKLGVDPAPIFAAVGIDMAGFFDPNAVLPTVDVARLVSQSQHVQGKAVSPACASPNPLSRAGQTFAGEQGVEGVRGAGLA